ELGHTFDSIDAVGGGAQSDVCLQGVADVWAIPVRRRSVVEEATSLGAAVIEAVGLGMVDHLGAARDLPTVAAESTPDPARHERYRERSARFAAASEALKPWFDEAGP